MILILGYGNPLRGDDGLGWSAAERLAGVIEGADVRAVHQLTPEMAEPVSRADLVIFVDAACDNNQGEVQVQEIRPRVSPSDAFSHQLTPDVLLTIAEKLYGRRPKAYLASVGAGSFDYGDRLSAAVESALPELIRSVQIVCGAHLAAARDS